MYCYEGYCVRCALSLFIDGEKAVKWIKDGNACKWCSGRLVPMGNSRWNGAAHDD